MIKDLEKFKLYKSSYDFQYLSLKAYAKSSLDYFAKAQSYEIKKTALQLQLDAYIEAQNKPKNNWVLPTSVGVVVGLLVGVVFGG